MVNWREGGTGTEGGRTPRKGWTDGRTDGGRDQGRERGRAGWTDERCESSLTFLFCRRKRSKAGDRRKNDEGEKCEYYYEGMLWWA